jgi:RimJ/RimL family protein N-acetyltransferase
MTSPHWPLTGLRLRTPRLELRWPTVSDLDELAALAVDGVHDPDVQPFGVAWTDTPAGELPSRSLRYYWAQWGAWRLNDWTLHLVAVHDGTVVGTQAMRGQDFAILREVGTGSWLGRRYHRRGLGTEMRAAVLSLAFDGLHAEYAVSTAHCDNAASLGVSRRLGYAKDGIERLVVREHPVTAQRLRLDRASWRAHSSLAVQTSGLEPCLPWFGLTS